MTLQEANEIIDRVTQMWPFQRLTQEELKEVEKAYKVLKEKSQQDMFGKLGEGRF